MQGTILSFTIQEGKGLISGDDGKRYEFEVKNWNSTNVNPESGAKVDFEISDNEAINIYTLGQAKQQQYQSTIQVSSQDTSVAAIFSLIFGILGVTSTWFFFAIPSIVAVILGHIALWNINSKPTKLGGRGLAIAGLLLGYFVIIIYLLLITIFVELLTY